MSIKVMTQVWELDLPRSEKLIALALADHGDDDGAHIYPSVARIAWKTGYSERQVQDILRALEARGLIRVVAYPNGGRGKATEYKMDIEKGARLAPFKPTNNAVSAPYTDEKDAETAPYQSKKGAVFSEKGAVFAQKGAPGCTPTVIETLRQPSDKNPSPQTQEQKPTPDAENAWDTVKEWLAVSTVEPTFRAFIAPTKAASFKNGTLTLVAPTPHVRARLDGALRRDLERAARQALGASVQIAITTGDTNGRPQV